jgi:hypothetical protein
MLGLLPSVELKVWRLALMDAESLAHQGDIAAGYDCLLTGLYRMLEFVADGERWADDLVRCYRAALTDYRHRHHVQIH